MLNAPKEKPQSDIARPATLDYFGSKKNHPHLILRLALIALIIVLCGAWWMWGTKIKKIVRLQYFQWQCLRFSKSPDSVAYESDQNRAMALAGSSNEYSINALGIAFRPEALRSLGKENPGSIYFPNRIVFMHERISLAGHRRLVIVIGPTDKSLDFQCRSRIPATFFGSVSEPQTSPVAEAINTSFFGGPLQDDKNEQRISKNPSDLKRDRDGYL